MLSDRNMTRASETGRVGNSRWPDQRKPDSGLHAAHEEAQDLILRWPGSCWRV